MDDEEREIEEVGAAVEHEETLKWRGEEARTAPTDFSFRRIGIGSIKKKGGGNPEDRRKEGRKTNF